jgi:hypothetical protein
MHTVKPFVKILILEYGGHMILKCCDCKGEKEHTEFYKYKEGYQPRCKDCTKTRNAIFKNKNPEYYKPGGTGYGYDKVEDIKQFNHNRYNKYKGRYEEYNNQRRQTPRGALSEILIALRGRSKKNGWTVDFDLEYLMTLYEQQEGKCAATGIPFDLSNKTRVKRFRPFSVSIDRIDSQKTYTKDNIRLVCLAFNLALNAFGDKVFEQVATGYLNTQRGIV